MSERRMKQKQNLRLPTRLGAGTGPVSRTKRSHPCHPEAAKTPKDLASERLTRTSETSALRS